MLTVNLHLCNGDVVALRMTRSQQDRLSRTLNQANLPATPFEVKGEGGHFLIPWRSIAYISTQPQAEVASVPTQAAV